VEYNEKEVIKYLESLEENSIGTKRELYAMLQDKFSELDYSLRQWRRRQDESDTLRFAIDKVVRYAQVASIKLTGLTATVQANEINTDKLYAEMVGHFDEIDKRSDLAKSNTFEIDTDGPVGIVFSSDSHFGGGKGTATDIKRIFEEAELVNTINNCYRIFAGDLCNNFIAPWTTSIAHNRKFTIQEEHAISRKYITLIKDKLIGFVNGNHDNWSAFAAGLDINLNLLNELTANCFYDDDELFISIKTPYANNVGIVTRHMWAGTSQNNATYGIEKGARLMPYDAKIFIGAHYHSGSYIRSFPLRGEVAYAALCGTPKRYDTYSKRCGFPVSNDTISLGIVIHQEFGIVPFDNLYAMKSFMENES